MIFGDLSSTAGLKELDNYLKLRSYISGYEPSQADCTVFKSVKKAPGNQYPYILRWYNHINSFGDKTKSFPAGCLPISVDSSVSAACNKAAADDDVDLFASDEDDEDAAKVKKEILAAYDAKKSKKPALIAKSSVVLDVKPWDDETSMKDMEKNVRSIEMDGLVWGASKLVPVGYGIKKLQIISVVEDEKVSIEELTEKIEAFEDYVQSVDVAAFNKI